MCIQRSVSASIRSHAPLSILWKNRTALCLSENTCVCKYCSQEQNQKTKEFRSWSNKSGLLCLTFDETDFSPSPTFHNWFVANRDGSSQWSNGVTEIKKFKVQVRNEGVFSYAIHITRSRMSFTLTYHVFNTYSREFHFLAWSRLNAVQAQITHRKIQDLRNEGPCQLTQMIVRWSSTEKGRRL